MCVCVSVVILVIYSYFYKHLSAKLTNANVIFTPIMNRYDIRRNKKYTIAHEHSFSP